ncbi:FAD-dependent oxidoreductase [bacterium]|nr:FAD-dependent oxidoreductase [bacterium]
METFDADAVVIGAGAVGLACGRALARAGREVLVLEATGLIGSETSSRNSEVVHAGIHYAPGSLKARLCVEGRRALYDYCAARGIEARMCGKFVVAMDDSEAAAIEQLFARALENGVEHVSLVDGVDARRIEPNLSADTRLAIVSPVSGLFDSHGFMLALQGEVEAGGGAVVFGAPVVGGRVTRAGLEIEVAGASPATIRARTVVNSAGHHALPIARMIEGGPSYPDLAMHWAKGSYFVASGRAPFSRLIYPMQSRASVGLHLTIDLGGRTRLGPDAEWLADDAGPPFDYRVDPDRAAMFYDAVGRYWPGVRDRDLSPDYSGVRPKLAAQGEPSADFMISCPAAHGVGGLVHLLGIESPGLTSSLAIGEHVAAMLDDGS